ncbi:hypothetical protein [Cohnella panacarvi]|uniref:hypothetical protein n=1 Tax=Cohnella panacarvi TaxID=400776 RepID=UPI000479CB27|nr:hypothetical protein [Cohnella panacarvi]
MRLQAKALFLLVAIAALVAGCMFGDPPLPKVAAGKTKIPVTQSSYCWGNKCADYAAPQDQLKDETPTIVEPGSDISIRYSGSKPKTLSVRRSGDGSFTDVPVEDGAIQAPTEPGVYYYLVSAWWKRGSSSGSFVIEVN